MTSADFIVGFCAHVLAPTGKLLVKTKGSQSRSLVSEEISNRIHIMEVVNNFDRTYTSVDVSKKSVGKTLQQIKQDDSFYRLWAYEGFGKLIYQEIDLDGLKAILKENEKSEGLLMLQAGIGLGIAQETLQFRNQFSGRDELTRLLEKMYQNNTYISPNGNADAGVESVGLVATMLYGLPFARKLSSLAAGIEESYPKLILHGAGRALYFRPGNFIPITKVWPNLTAAQSDPNLFGGFVWAQTLVNLRSPKTITHFQKSLSKDFQNQSLHAMAQALKMRKFTHCDDTYVDVFLNQKSPLNHAVRSHMKKLNTDKLFYIDS